MNSVMLRRCISILAVMVCTPTFAFGAATAAPEKKAGVIHQRPTQAGTAEPTAFSGPTATQQAIIAAAREDLAATQREIGDAEAEGEKLTGGLIKVLIEARIETLRLTAAMLKQRIAALETGAVLAPVKIPSTAPDPDLAASLKQEIDAQEAKIAKTKSDADQYSGGLIRVQLLAAEATQAQTLAMLEQRYLSAKYGLTISPRPEEAAKGSTTLASQKAGDSHREKPPQDSILDVSLVSKRLIDQNYGKFLVLDMDITANGLDRPARSIKGLLIFTDLFDEPKIKIEWTIDEPVEPGVLSTCGVKA